jgi:hypothetical protein
VRVEAIHCVDVVEHAKQHQHNEEGQKPQDVTNWLQDFHRNSAKKLLRQAWGEMAVLTCFVDGFCL